MDKLVPVSQKGQVVIPAALRKKHKIGRVVVISEADGKITIQPARSMEESFGAGGDDMLEVAREISRRGGAKLSLNARSYVFDAGAIRPLCRGEGCQAYFDRSTGPRQRLCERGEPGRVLLQDRREDGLDNGGAAVRPGPLQGAMRPSRRGDHPARGRLEGQEEGPR